MAVFLKTSYAPAPRAAAVQHTPLRGDEWHSIAATVAELARAAASETAPLIARAKRLPHLFPRQGLKVLIEIDAMHIQRLQLRQPSEHLF